MDSPECTSCHDDYTIDSGLDACEHGMCWPCASAALDGALAEVERLRAELWRVEHCGCPDGECACEEDYRVAPHG